MFIVQDPPALYPIIFCLFLQKKRAKKKVLSYLFVQQNFLYTLPVFIRSHRVCTFYFFFLPSAEKTPAQIPNTAMNAMIPIIQPCVIVIASISFSPFNLLSLPL